MAQGVVLAVVSCIGSFCIAKGLSQVIHCYICLVSPSNQPFKVWLLCDGRKKYWLAVMS